MRDEGRGRATFNAVVVGVAVTAAHLVLTLFMQAPIVQPDELGYVDGARRLALGGPRPVTAYYPGLSALLVPVWRFTLYPLSVWRSALWINSGLCGLTAALTWALIPRLGFGSLRPGRRLLITALVSAYPAIVLYSNVSMAESLFATGATGLVLMAVWCFHSLDSTTAAPSPARWMVLGLGAGLLTAVHPRGLAIAIAVVIVTAVVLQPWHRTAPIRRSRPASWARMLALISGAVLGLAGTRILLVAVRPSTGTGLGAYRADAVVGRAMSAGAVRLLAMGLSGQLLYLAVATIGLAPLGLWLGLADLIRLIRQRVTVSPAVVGRALVGLSSLGILGMSVLFLNGGDRADQLIYGRYNEGAVVGLLIVAATWLVGSPLPAVRRCLTWFAVSGATVATGVIVLSVGLTPGQRRAPLNPGTVLALGSVLRRSGPYLDIAAIAVVGTVALVAVGLILWRLPAVALAVITLVFAFASYDTFRYYMVPGARARARQDVLAETIARASSVLHIAPSCIGFDAGVDFTYFNDRFYLPGWQIEPFDGSTGAPGCGPFAISTRPNFFAFHPGSQIVSVENDLPMILYVLPSPTLAKLQSAGWLLPALIPGPLNIDAQRATVTGPGSVSIRSGKSSTVTVHAANVAAHGNPWPNKLGLRTDGYVVRVTARWFRPGQIAVPPGLAGDDPVATSSIELPRTLLPGQKTVLHLKLTPRTAGGANLPPGQYVVLVAVYQELVGTIPGGVLSIPVTVTA